MRVFMRVSTLLGRRLFLSLCVLCCLAFVPALASFAHAAKEPGENGTVYLQADYTAPIWNTDSLRVTFTRDEAQCRREYGENWWNGCFASLGSAGAPVKGVELRGAALPAGEWRWEDYSTMIFTPTASWPAGAVFTVDMSTLMVPLRVRINTRILKGSTLPPAGQSAKGEVWIDPSASGPHALSFALRFTAPVGKSMEKAITVKERGAAPRANQKGGMALGPVQVVWGQDNTSCLVKVPVTALPDKDTVLTLQVADVRPLAIKNGKARLLAGNLQQTATVPGRQQLFRVSKASLGLETTENLRREYRLSLKTSLRVPAAELLKALQVVELPRLQNPEASEPYAWNVAPAITQADIARARPLKAELVRDPGSSGEPLLLRVPATPGSFVYCQLPAGFGPKGYTLSAPWAAVFSAEQAGSSVNFLQPGHVLTLTPGGDNRLDIVSSGVDEVRWRATRIRAENLNLLQIMGGVPNRFDLYSYMDVAGTVVEGTLPLADAHQNGLTPSFSSLTLTELMRGGTGVLHVELRGMQGGKEVAQASRMVLATDLGMVSKVLPDGARQVYVCSLSSGQPVQNAVVRILGANGQSVAEARTDAAGYAALPAVRGLAREKEAVALVASRAVHSAGSGTAQTPAQAAAQTPAQAAAQTPKTDAAAEDMAWMALDDSARRVDYSRFPTQGQVSSPDNINAYVFGQRGIFRPGETLRFGVMLRRGDWKALPPDLPLVATLTDSAGRVAMRRNFTVGQGLVELSWASLETSPTGRYRLDVTSPASDDIMGTGAVRVEEFQPDTLAIRAEVVTGGALADGSKAAAPKIPASKTPAQKIPEGWLVTFGDAAEASLAVYLRNFYGLPAEGRTVRAELSVRPAELRFAGFEDFTFPDMLPLPATGEAATATALPAAQTTAAGEALVPLPLAAYQKRTMQCRVLVEGFEADGGRAVTTEKIFLVSPLPVMLGYRLSGAVSSTGYVPQGTQGGLEFVALGPDVRPATAQALGPVHLSVAERRYVTVLATDAQGKYVYEENPVDKEISGSTARLDAGGRLLWNMPTDKPGEYLLTVRDSGQRVMARIPYTVAGNDDVRAALEPEASALPPTQMRLRLDKTDYAPGDTVNLFLAAPYAGVGLITLERDRVARHVWFKAPAGNSVHTLTIPHDFEGRGYINVSMGRAVTSSEIFMQPHSFAVAPLTVNAAGRDMGLKVEAPREVLPGTALKARVTARHKGKALIFAVDEGVLQLTRFTTPDPLRYLLLDRALEVATDQLFDLLMPVHSQLSKRLPAFGGDMHRGGGRFNNPFKRRNEPPLAWWSGLVDTGPEGTEVSIPVPAYTNGQVRIMVVAASPDTVGSAEGSTVARAALVITPQLPLMAAPGDVFEGGIALHNTTDKPLVLGLKTEMTGLAPEKTVPEKVEMAAGKEIFVPLRMQAAAVPGEASFTVVATPETAGAGGMTGAGESAAQEFRRTATLSVRPAVLPSQEQRTGFASGLSALKDGNLPAEALTRDLFTFRADAAASVSTAPLPPVRVLLRSLAAYPYACVEQSISRALPLVLLQRRAGMAALLTPPVINGKPRAEEHARVLEGAITAIRAGFKPEMGVSFWADAPGADTLLTAYAGDYLLLLREAGLTVPGDLSTNFFTTLKERVTSTPESLADARAHAYGLWVLTRHGFITAQWLDALREQLDARWPRWQEDVTGTLMAGSYAIMNMHDAAQELIYTRGAGTLMEREWGQLTPLAAQALHVTVLARHFPEFLADKAGKLATVLVEGVDSSYGSTLEAALGARALLELAVPVKSTAAGIPAGANAGDKRAATAGTAFAGMELRCTAWQPGFEPVAAVAAAGSTTANAEVADLPLLSLHAPGCTQFSLSPVGTGDATAEGKMEGTAESRPTGTPGGKAVAKAAPASGPASGLTTSLYWDVSSDGYDRQPPATAAVNGMEVTRVLKRPDGTVLGGTVPGPDATVRQGTVLRVELTSRVFRAENGPFGGAQSQEVVLADLLPGGFELVLTHPDDVIPSTSTGEGYFRLDRREDRVLAYATVVNAPVTFVYHVRAVNRGRYTLPAAYGEGLYDRSCRAHSAAGVIIVE